jgi:carboxylesterase
MPLAPGAQPFTSEGDALGVLVLHDIAGSPTGVLPWARYLADAGHTVSLPRLPGHGTRWQDLNRTSWEDWYAEAERNLAWVSRRCPCVVVMGLGMGGTLALRVTEVHPEVVRGLVLLNTPVHSERRGQRLLPVVARIVPSLPGLADDIKREGVDEGGYDRLPLKAALSQTRLWGVVKKDIHRVHQPVLLFRSADDHVVEPSNAAWILANIRSTDATEVVLENSYHVATVDDDAPTVFAGSLDFLRRVCGP